MNQFLSHFRDQPEALLSKKLADCFRFAIPAGIVIALAYIFYLNSFGGSCCSPGGRNIGLTQWFCVTLNCLIAAANPAFFCILKGVLYLLYQQDPNHVGPIPRGLFETTLPLLAYLAYVLLCRPGRKVQYSKFLRQLLVYSLLFLLMSPFANQITSAPATMVGWANVIILGNKYEHAKLFTGKADLGLQLVSAYCAIGQYQNATQLLNQLINQEMNRDPIFGDSLLGAFYSIKRIDKDHTLSKDQWIALCQPIETQLLKLYRYYKHKRAFYPLTDSFAESEYGVRQFSHGLIEAYKNHGAVEKVLEWNLRNLHEQRNEYGDNSATYAYYLMDLARAYQACGMNSEASSTLEIAIARLESKPPHQPLSRRQPTKSDIARDQQYEHRDIQNCQELLGSISSKELSQGKTQPPTQSKSEVKANLLTSLADGIAKTKKGFEHSSDTLTYQKTSGQQVEMPYEDFDVAHSRYRLELAKISKLHNTKDVETCLRKLAELCYCHCRYKEAEDYYRQLLDVQTGISFAERTQRFTDRTELADLAELAGACSNQGEFSKAAVLFEKVIQKKKKLDGSNYADMARDLNNLAGLYFLQSDFKRAKPLNEQALALDQSRLGANHPAIAIYLKHLGQIHLELNEQEEAQKCFDRAHTIDRKVSSAN